MRTFLILLAVTNIISFWGCNTAEDPFIENISLSQQQAEDLFFLREEEKLARDVYLYAGSLYDINVFRNIPNSEQVHMNKVLELIEKYDLQDPALEEQGKFSNSDLQDLFDALTSKAKLSVEDALEVGATIEDLDIFDLDVYLERAEQDDIREVMELLKCGSENHMRGFTNAMILYNVEYSPQYISEEAFQEILNGDHAHCGQ